MKLIFPILFCLFPLLAVNVYACSCYSSAPLYDYYKGTSTVFTGKVLGSKDIEVSETYVDAEGNREEDTVLQRVFRFEVIDGFKGIRGKTVEINVGEFKNSCYRGFAVGESYLIYADRDEDGILNHSFCSRSEILKYAQDQLHFIREMLNGKPESQIYGAVLRSDTYPGTLKERLTTLSGIKIVLRGAEKQFEAVTDKGGFYKFNNIPDGLYELRPVTEDIYSPYFPASEKLIIENGKITPEYERYLRQPFNAFYQSFSLGWNTRVTGKVYDGEGKTVKNAAVRLLPVSMPFAEIESDDSSDSLDEGKFWCSKETPGKYFLVVEVFAPFGQKDRIRIFYPQADSPEKAVQINLKAAEDLNFDFILPDKLLTREIRGTIVWSDGTIVDRAKISLRKSEEFVVSGKEDLLDRGFDWDITDEQGNFVLQGFEGGEYWLHYWDHLPVQGSDEEEEILIKGKPVKIKIGKTNEPVKLVLTKP